MRCGPQIRWVERPSDRQATLAAVAALASDGFAVDFQRVHEHLRMRAIRVGALPVRTVMADQGSVAVRSAGQTLAAFGPRNVSCSVVACSVVSCSVVSCSVVF